MSSFRDYKHTQPPWMRKIKVGSVLRNKRGTDYRVVRAVSFYRDGALRGVTFAIRHCSWTTRPCTIYNYTDLLYAGYSLIEGVRIKLDKIWDYNFEDSLHAKFAKDCKVNCCDVKGLP